MGERMTAGVSEQPLIPQPTAMLKFLEKPNSPPLFGILILSGS
jgi:hypothetical protein